MAEFTNETLSGKTTSTSFDWDDATATWDYALGDWDAGQVGTVFTNETKN